jgi:hypothetical protein
MESWREVTATLETVHRNVQRGLHPPIETETARSLGDHVTAMLDFLDAEVADLIQHGKAAGSSHENVMALGERASQSLAVQAEFSSYYFDRTVQSRRKERPVDQFDAELTAMEERCERSRGDLLLFVERTLEILRAATAS